jgi:hypothetical protein
MWHTLSRCLTILYRDVEGVGFVDSLEGPLNSSDGVEEIADFIAGEVRQSRLYA